MECNTRFARENDFCKTHHISTTKTWTTDAFYRETDNSLTLRKNEGCSAVEMECASIMAVGQFRHGQFRHKEVYQFLYAADCLDDNSWNKRVLENLPNNLREKMIVVATEVAHRRQPIMEKS